MELGKIRGKIWNEVRGTETVGWGLSAIGGKSLKHTTK